jgi:peptidoglycan/xylan/chitin deacetylase (PgdA/CDA1 family)
VELRPLLVRPGHKVLGLPPVARAAACLAAARANQLVLVFHRVADGLAVPGGVIPAVGSSMFRDQLGVLMRLGDVVPLERLSERTTSSRRPRFALTFDDDFRTHHEVVLPILQELKVPATFFLCGRSLRDLGPLWFETLDTLVLTQGVEGVAKHLGVPARSAQDIAIRCQHDAALRYRLQTVGPVGPEPLSEAAIRTLVEAGMAVGFHTLDHHLLPALSDEEVDAALMDGRSALETVVGAPLDTFAYPHGVADRRVADRVKAAGFRWAWTGRQRPVRRGDDPFLLGRWEPGPLPAPDFQARVVANLNGWAGV